MDRGQEQTTEDNALLHESGQQPEADVPEDGLQVSFVQIQIERHHGPRVGKRAVVYCDLDESQMTEACVRELGFSLQTRAGQNRRRLRLLLGAPGEPHLFKVTFKIVAEADHDISLNEAASDKLHESSRGANYTVFAVPGVRILPLALQSSEECDANIGSIQDDTPEENPGSEGQTRAGEACHRGENERRVATRAARAGVKAHTRGGGSAMSLLGFAGRVMAAVFSCRGSAPGMRSRTYSGRLRDRFCEMGILSFIRGGSLP